MVVEAIQKYAEQKLDDFLKNAPQDARERWASIDNPASVAGIFLMCDGSPAAKIVKNTKDRCIQSTACTHTRAHVCLKDIYVSVMINIM